MFAAVQRGKATGLADRAAHAVAADVAGGADVPDRQAANEIVAEDRQLPDAQPTPVTQAAEERVVGQSPGDPVQPAGDRAGVRAGQPGDPTEALAAVEVHLHQGPLGARQQVHPPTQHLDQIPLRGGRRFASVVYQPIDHTDYCQMTILRRQGFCCIFAEYCVGFVLRGPLTDSLLCS